MKPKTIKILYWIVTILFSLFMILAGISEFLHTESADKVITDLGYPLYFNTIIGIAKILGAIVLLVPSFKILKEWAYAGFTIDMVGAIFSYALHGEGIQSILGPLPFLAIMFISYFLWKKTKNN